MLSERSFRLQAPEDFDFWTTVWSSGWCGLAPFSYDEERRTLSRVQGLTSGKIVKATMMEERKGVVTVRVRSREELDGSEMEELEGVVETCLGMDEDLSPLHAMLDGYPEFRWVREMGAGRCVRSPTVFEDVVKTISSTNCSWALTRAVTERLCRRLGGRFSEEECTFPTPRQMASASEEFMRAEIKAGYRSPYLVELARKIVDGELDVEVWRNSPLDSASLKLEIMKVRGVGDYAAGHILKLLGRYDFLALDSWLRRRFAQIHRGGEAASDREIEEFYAPFGRWKGLVLWLDMVKDHLT
ncbi:MAG: DNA-3-methyladenine glycosylase family protein [Candidatus Bathyarchaeia archaeon]